LEIEDDMAALDGGPPESIAFPTSMAEIAANALIEME